MQLNIHLVYPKCNYLYIWSHIGPFLLFFLGRSSQGRLPWLFLRSGGKFLGPGVPIEVDPSTTVPSLPCSGCLVAFLPLSTWVKGPLRPLGPVAFCSCPCFFLSPLLLVGCGSSGDSGLDRWTCHLPHLLLAGVSGSVGVGGDDVEVLLVLAGLELPGSPSCVGSVCRTLFLVFPAT